MYLLFTGYIFSAVILRYKTLGIGETNRSPAKFYPSYFIMYKQIKPDMIFHYFDQDIDLINEILELVVDLNIQDLKNLMPLYELGEVAAIKQKFHKSKPVFGFLGASGVNQHIETIEEDIQNRFPIYHKELLVLLDELEEDLQAFLKKTVDRKDLS
jgi:hypothetical protein